jgi:hypothetical protein
MAAIPKLDEANLQAIYDLLGDTSTGLTGCEIGRILRECGCLDPMASEDRATSDTSNCVTPRSQRDPVFCT